MQRSVNRTFIGNFEQAVQLQALIGWDYFMRGYLASDWLQALQSTGSRGTDSADPEQQLGTVLKALWFEVAQPMWHHRNDLAHGANSALTSATDERLNQLLLWYHEHQEQLLPYHQQYLRRFDTVHEITNMRHSTKKAWIKHLSVAAKEWKKYKELEDKQLQPITKFFQPINGSNPRRN